MKRELIILSALTLSLAFLNGCGEKEDPSAQDPPDKKESPNVRPKFSIPPKQTDSEESAAKRAPADDTVPAEPETPEDATSNETDAPVPAEPPGKTAPPAVVAFKAQLKEKGIWNLRRKLKNMRDGGGRDPFAMLDGLRDLGDLNDKLSTVNTEGLPADLKEPAEHFRDATADITTHLEEMPIPLDILTAGPEVMQEWFAEKAVEDPGFMLSMQDWGRTMGELSGEMEEANTNLDNALSEYGIDPSAE